MGGVFGFGLNAWCMKLWACVKITMVSGDLLRSFCDRLGLYKKSSGKETATPLKNVDFSEKVMI